jgi:GTP diphosphokinase / guanosine-3',5'-bis(diphosphate) 3'-diphosphatase
LANCCCPLPEDEIIGFVSRGKGVIVHRANCHNIARLREQDRERLIPVSWIGVEQQRYHAPVIIMARDRQGLMRDLATVISDAGANMLSVNFHINGNRETIIVNATIEIADLDQLQRLLRRLASIKDVQSVQRDLGKQKI